MPTNPFPSEALTANRRGELTVSQRDAFARALGSRNRRATIVAAVLFVVAVLFAFVAPASLAAVWRVAIVGVALGICASLILRALTGADRALGRDLREGRVEFLSGPVSREEESAMDVESTSVYFLRVGDQRFLVTPQASAAAPRAGQVRIYFLPHSRKVVNLEPLEGTAAVSDVGQRPLRESIVGTWRNNFAHATFTSDGRVTASVMGRKSAGQWSVDAQGLLNAEIAGRAEVVEASVHGDELRIALGGKGYTLTRTA